MLVLIITNSSEKKALRNISLHNFKNPYYNNASNNNYASLESRTSLQKRNLF